MRSAAAAGPTNRAVLRIAPIVSAHSATDERERQEVAEPDEPHGDAAGGGKLGTGRDQQQRPRRDGHEARARPTAEDDDDRHGDDEAIENTDPNRIVTAAPVVL